MDAFTPNAAYLSLNSIRDLIETLQGGTMAMRAAGKKYLPQEPAEADDDYNSRLARSVLFNQFTRTLKAAAGKVLSKPLNFKDLPATMEGWVEDIDLEGNHIDQFSKMWFTDGAAHGVSFVLVDAPKSSVANRTRLTDRLEGIRPYFVHVPNKRLINWRFERVSGVRRLALAVIDESGMVPDGEFGERRVKRVRILRPGSYEVREQNNVGDKTEELVVESGETGLDFIPLVPFYANRTGLFTGISPLTNLAELNLRHWQSQSDQNNILKVARVPILARTRGNMSSDDEGEDLVVGGNMAVDLEPNGKLEWVEHTGASIEAGRKDLHDLEDKMTKVGFQMVARETSGDVTATETSVMTAEAHAALTAMAENFKDALELALLYAAKVGGEKAEPSVIINKDFGSVTAAIDVPLLIQLHEAGVIDQPTVVSESKRRGLLSEDVKAEAVAAPRPTA